MPYTPPSGSNPSTRNHTPLSTVSNDTVRKILSKGGGAQPEAAPPMEASTTSLAINTVVMDLEQLPIPAALAGQDPLLGLTRLGVLSVMTETVAVGSPGTSCGTNSEDANGECPRVLEAAVRLAALGLGPVRAGAPHRPSPFYISDEDEPLSITPRRVRRAEMELEPEAEPATMALVPPSPLRDSGPPSPLRVSGLRASGPDLQEILRFPTESTHAYSYAQLASNSLALRLNVLKRSLEILVERPELLAGLSGAASPKHAPLAADYFSVTPTLSPSFLRSVLVNTRVVSGSGKNLNPGESTGLGKALGLAAAKMLPLQGNASSAALAALFSPERDPSGAHDLRSVIRLLDQGGAAGLSLVDVVGLNLLPVDSRGDGRVRAKLLHALAMPFMDVPGPASLQAGSSSVALSSLAATAGSSWPAPPAMTPSGPAMTPSGPATRAVHSVFLQRNQQPQAVFTCSLTPPWQLKAANDLSCLMFGLLRRAIRATALMDLIAPQSRSLVMDRLTLLSQAPTMFAGEIVAVTRPGTTPAWTSLWGKKKDNMIILMFDQITCDAFDVTIQGTGAGETVAYTVAGVAEHRGLLALLAGIAPGQPLARLAPAIDRILHLPLADFVTPPLPHEAVEISAKRGKMALYPRLRRNGALELEIINDRRYFTLPIQNHHVPCAIRSNCLETGSNHLPVKLKIHAMPYIAGLVVVSALTFDILAFNPAITKNLFGRADVAHRSIDLLLPNFTQLLKDATQEIHLAPGTVLPEHFFRKALAAQQAASSGKRGRALGAEAERRFLDSDGVAGIHYDGAPLRLDVLLRVSSADTFVLWITYRRNLEDEAIAVPDQRRLYLAHEEDFMNCGEHVSSGTAETPTTAGTTGTTGTTDTTETPPSDGAGAGPASGYLHDINPTDLAAAFSEASLLAAENARMAVVEAAPLWPRAVGAQRRTKRYADFATLKEMGSGAYGKVRLSQHLQDPAYTVIIKCIDKERILVDTWVRDRKLGTIPSEIQIMNFLMADPHPNVMRIVDFFEDDQYYYLETPLHGDPCAIDLFDCIEIRKDMSETEMRVIFRQIASALAHCHKHGIVHRDIKDENVIVDERGVVKLIDFGSAAYTRQGPFDVFVGTIDYAAPEVLNGKPYEGKPQDVWALGVLLYTLMYKENPYYNVDEIMDGELRFPYVLSEAAVALIRMALVRDVSKRPTVDAILAHEWLVL